MRLESIPVRTRLLVVIAGLALLFWLATWAGLGRQIDALPTDPALLQPLPKPVPASADRLGPLTSYGEIGARPLFTSDRRPKPFSLQADDDQAERGFDYMLTGVLLTPSLQIAIVQPRSGGQSLRLRVGSHPEGSVWRLVELKPRSAVFAGPEGERTLELRVYDGVGGAPPTTIQISAQESTPTAPPRAVPPPAAAVPPPPEAATVVDPAAMAAEQVPATPEERTQSIRDRIEARRAELRREARRQQQQDSSSEPQAPTKPVE